MTQPAVAKREATKEKVADLNYCFDVFDTLLTRLVGHPNDVFLLLGERLRRRNKIACSAEVFARQRMLADERASTILNRHPPLAAIYAELVRSLVLPESAIEDFVTEESQLEEELIKKVPRADELIQAARERAKSVSFVTDTNFSADFIRSLLDKFGLWKPGDRIFASCECGADKARGLLFPHVARELGAKPGSFVHHGDNAIADRRNGRLSGWTVNHLPDGELNRYEKALVKQSYATGGLSSLFAGASRLARLSTDARTERDRVLSQVAAGVMAPTVVAWVLWIMHRAVADGCRRLYFISRDGQILVEIARRLEVHLKTGIELRYLYGSRRAVIAAEPNMVVRDSLRAEFCTLNDIANSLSVPADEMSRLLPAEFSDLSRWGEIMTAEQRDAFREAIRTEGFQSLLGEAAAEPRKLLFDYLEQEGWKDDEPFGLVDIGWRATTAGALDAILDNTAFRKPVRYYFYGLGDDAHRVAGSAVVPYLDAWFFDDAGKHGYLPYPQGTIQLLEMFCAADHGTVTGYKTENERIVPTLKEETSAMWEWGYPLLRETTMRFTAFLVESLELNLVDARIDVRHGVNAALELFWLAPTKTEAEFWGSYPTDLNFNNSLTRTLVEPVSLAVVVENLRAGRLQLRSNHTWAHGTAMMSPFIYRTALHLGWRLRDRVPQLKNRFRWLKAQIELLRTKKAT